MLLSGAEQCGGGLRGILRNAPNALLGLFFLVSVAVAWKREAVGGIVLILEGLLILIGYPMLVRDKFSLSGIILIWKFCVSCRRIRRELGHGGSFNFLPLLNRAILGG